MTRVIGHGNCFRDLHLKSLVISINHKEKWSLPSLIAFSTLSGTNEQLGDGDSHRGRPSRPGGGFHSSEAYRFGVSNLAEGRAGGCFSYGGLPAGRVPVSMI